MKERYSDAYLLEYSIKKRKVIEIVRVDISKEIDYFVEEGEASTLSVEKNAIAVTSDRAAYRKMFKRYAKVIQTDLMFLKRLFRETYQQKETTGCVKPAPSCWRYNLRTHYLHT